METYDFEKIDISKLHNHKLKELSFFAENLGIEISILLGYLKNLTSTHYAVQKENPFNRKKQPSLYTFTIPGIKAIKSAMIKDQISPVLNGVKKAMESALEEPLLTQKAVIERGPWEDDFITNWHRKVQKYWNRAVKDVEKAKWFDYSEVNGQRTRRLRKENFDFFRNWILAEERKIADYKESALNNRILL